MAVMIVAGGGVRQKDLGLSRLLLVFLLAPLRRLVMCVPCVPSERRPPIKGFPYLCKDPLLGSFFEEALCIVSAKKEDL